LWILKNRNGSRRAILVGQGATCQFRGDDRAAGRDITIVERRSIPIERGEGRISCFDLAVGGAKKANSVDQLPTLRGLIKKEIGSGDRKGILVVERGVIRDDDDRRRHHQLPDVSKDVDPAAAMQHGIDNRHSWVSVENHRHGVL